MKRVAILAALAAGVTLAMPPASAADIDIDAVAGVYKKSFKNANISGDKYDSEDILEIVKVSPSAAYIRIHLEFFNGHICDIWGVAKTEIGALVYRGAINVQGKQCVLGVKVVRGKVTLDDKEGACAIGTCGNRGMYNRTVFDLKKRRAIRYMDLLLKSDQYKDAVDEHEGKPRSRMP